MPQDTHDDRQPEAECLPVPRKEAQPAASALIVREGQVILPEINEICPDDKAFEAVYATTLSQEELPELLNALHARRPAYSLLQKGCFLVGGLVLALLAYWLCPRLPELTEMRGPVIETQSSSRVSSDLKPLLKEAEAAYRQGKYGDVLRILKPQMATIMANRESFLANERIPFLYYDSCIKGVYPLSSGRQDWLNRACSFAPDNLEWHLFKAYSQWMPYQDCYKNRDRLLQEFPDSGNSLAYCRAVAASLNRIRGKNANQPAEKRLAENTIATLDLMECQVLITIWLLDGARLTPEDGEGGVIAREKAFRLAARHPNDLAFIDMQLFIANRIKETSLLKWYYFKGKKRWRPDELTSTIQELEDKRANCLPPKEGK